MPTVEQIKRLTIQAKTEGVSETTAALDKLKGSYSGVAGVSEQTEQKTKSVSAAFDRLQRTLDTDYRALQAYSKQQDVLNRAFQQGLVTQTRYDELAAMASLRLNDNAKATDTLAKSHAGLSNQAMAASHSLRSSVEMLAMGVGPSQVLASQLNHLSFAATGPGGLKGAFKEVGASVLGVLSAVSPLTLGLIAVGGAAVLWGTKTLGAIDNLDERMKAHIELVNSLKESYRDAGKGIDTSVKESQDVLKALLSISTDKLQKDFQRLAQSAAAPGQQMAQFVDDFGRIIDTGADKFAPFRKAIDDFNASVRAGKADVSNFRSAISDVVNSSSDQKVRAIGGELLDASKNAGDLANNLRAVNDAGKSLDVAALAAAAMNKNFASAMQTLSGTVTKSLTDRQKIEKNYQEAMKSANSDSSQMAAMAERDNQLAILSYNDRKKAADEAAKAQEAAAKRFDSLINSQSKKNAGIDGQIAAIGQGVGELARLETQYKLTEAAQQAFGTVSDKTAAKIKAVSDAAGAAALTLAQLKLASDIKFDLSQIGLSDSEQSANSKLRSIYGDTGINSAQAQFYKQQLLINDALKQYNDVSKSALTGFIQDISSGKNALEALGSALQKVGNKLIEMSVDGLWGKAFGGSSGGLGWLGGLLGIGGGSASAASYGPITLGSAAGPTAFSAKGNAFDNDNIVKFAMGGTFTNRIVTNPTPFKFANGAGFGNGLMGEAGPEAVVPLRRMSNGNLGVHMSGGGRSAPQKVDVSVGVAMDKNGNLQAYVKNIAQGETRDGLAHYTQSDVFMRAAAHATERGKQRGWVR